MNTGRVVAVASALLAAVSMVVAWYYYEGIMVVISLFALVFGAIASKRCSARANRFILIASAVCLVCTILSVTVLSQGNFLDEDGNPSTLWFVIIGLVHSVPVVPLTFSTFVVTASVTGASYNWAVVRGLSVFIGMGMEVPGFVLEYIFEGSDNWMTDNGYILYHFLMTAIVTIVCSYLISREMKKGMIIITEEGVRPLNADRRAGPEGAQDRHGHAGAVPAVVPLHLGVRVPGHRAGHRVRASGGVPGGDLHRLGDSVGHPADPQAGEAGLHAQDVPGRGLREHVLLRHLAQRRALPGRQLVGRHGPRDLLGHRVRHRLHRALPDGVPLPAPRHLRQQERDDDHAVPGGPELRRDLGDDGGLRRLRRRGLVHGVRGQRHHGRPDRRPDRRGNNLRRRVHLPRQAHGGGRLVHRQAREEGV